MKLLSDVPPSKTRGLKVLTVGILIAAAGFVIASLGAIDLGWLITWGGGVLGLVGLLWHFWLMLTHFMAKKNSPPGSARP
jgi:hypothetical protein